MHRRHERYLNQRAFTLVELLVVIGIIALLISILMPALQRARFKAKEVMCMSNIRQMILAQHAYLASNKGKFPPHRAAGPMYVRDESANPPGSKLYRQNPFYSLDKSYITTPYITLCPFVDGDGSDESNPYFRAGDYGFWASDAPMTLTDYCFFANWVPSSTPPGTTNPQGWHTYYSQEKAWPRNAQEAASDRVMMAHGVYFHSNLGGGWDGGHGSKKGAWNPIIPTESRQLFTRSMPVGYGDGHVELHVRDSFIKRASWNDPYYGITYWWY